MNRNPTRLNDHEFIEYVRKSKGDKIAELLELRISRRNKVVSKYQPKGETNDNSDFYDLS